MDFLSWNDKARPKQNNDFKMKSLLLVMKDLFWDSWSELKEVENKRVRNKEVGWIV